MTKTVNPSSLASYLAVINSNTSKIFRFKKRPGLDQFLQTVANSNFEVVIFTTENVFMIWPVIDKLDPENKLINYRLFRDSTHFIDGVHVKNLDGLNRDLSKVCGGPLLYLIFYLFGLVNLAVSGKVT